MAGSPNPAFRGCFHCGNLVRLTRITQAEFDGVAVGGGRELVDK
jgi:hypothetical protein